MYYTIYKTTNLIDGKFYIGKHKTNNINDRYFGSGIWIKRAIKKYGKKNFIKEIISVYDSEAKMNLAEKILVVYDLEISYNLSIGGKGGFDYINKNGLSKGANNIMRNIEIKNVVICKMKETRSKNKEFYSNIGKENIKKAHLFNKGKKRPEHSQLMKEKGFLSNLYKNNKELFRDMLSSWFLVISPDKVEYKTNRLKDFCKEKNLTYVSIWNTSLTNKVVSKGKSKGWICQKI